ncbi:hypothetical protein DAPPUDRAFT_100451 [Daphnia pulex]|uniref:Uncharacterized protein n=1 Tax=Daphnia pulex TaxID=6669 RepID=E9GAF4_DAPPU|nr:hypothetical protein DAPPUDRAFT_100451 [Daphnia pulex]|eukprot:EFX83534.1 hypothetical protein DAPPUDRAFT_100451 [Daphnia pulex]
MSVEEKPSVGMSMPILAVKNCSSFHFNYRDCIETLPRRYLLGTHLCSKTGICTRFVVFSYLVAAAPTVRIVFVHQEMADIGFVMEKVIKEFTANVQNFSLFCLAEFRDLMSLHDTIYFQDNIEQTMVGKEKHAETVYFWNMLREGGMEMKCRPFRFTHRQISLTFGLKC